MSAQSERDVGGQHARRAYRRRMLVGVLEITSPQCGEPAYMVGGGLSLTGSSRRDSHFEISQRLLKYDIA